MTSIHDPPWEDNDEGKKFLEINERQFLSSRFKGKSDYYSFFVEDIPQSFIPKFIEDLKEVGKKLELECQISKYTQEKKKTMGVMMATRPWNFNPLEELSN